MITTKQRAALRSLANGIDPIFQIGKNGLEENFYTQLAQALEKRELIKINVLENSDIEPKDAQKSICDALECEGVQVIGNKIVIYKEAKNPANRKIRL